LRVNSPANRSIFPYYLGRRGSTADVSIQYTKYTAKQNVKGKRPGQAIHIVNNVDYIHDLNAGKSFQEAPGFVERAVLKGRLYIRATGLKQVGLNSVLINRTLGT